MRSIVALVFLAACSTAPAPVPPDDVRLLRNPTAQMGSQADVTADDLAGDWIVRQGVADGWPARVGIVSFAADGQTLNVEVEGGFCEEDGACVTIIDRTGYVPGLPGRFRASVSADAVEAGLPEEIWVLWMDFDRRTVALGDPSGTFVAILDRNSTGGADRIAAARDILDWYGYDLRRLEEVE